MEGDSGLAVLVGGLALVNGATFFLFGWDKRQARRRGRRVRERSLLALAALGGTPAAYWARARFRHKTRKQPFVGILHLIALAQLCGLGGLVWWALRLV